MIRLKNTVSFICIMGALLGQGGVYSSLAMEKAEDGIESGRKRAAAGGSAVDKERALTDEAVLLPLAPSQEVAASAAPINNDERLERLMRTLAAHQRLPVTHEGTPVDKQAFFFAAIPPRQQDSIEGAPKTIPSTTYKITSVENTDKGEMGALQRSALEELGKALFVSLPKSSGHLGWGDSLETRDYPMGPFADRSSMKSAHLFFIPKSHKKPTLKEYLEEGICWVEKQETSLRGTARTNYGGKEILFRAETNFSPIQCTLAGLFYVVHPTDRRVFILGLAESSLFAVPQFVQLGETTLEQRSWADLPPRREGQEPWKALANWIYINPDESSVYCTATFPVSYAVDEYNEEWWKNWVEGVPEEEKLILFLRNFEESLLGQFSKEKGPPAQAMIAESDRLSVGFFQVLSTSPVLGGQNYGYVDADYRLYATEKYGLVLRGERQVTSIPVTAYKKGSVAIFHGDRRQISPLIPLGFHEISEIGREHPKWTFHDGSTLNIPGNSFGVERKGETNASAPLLKVLQAGSLGYISVVRIEDYLIPEGFMPSLPGIMSQWSHLKELTLRKCFAENSLHRETAQPFFNALRGLSNLERLDLSGNLFEMDGFRALLLTLLGGGPEKLKSVSLSLPKKPRVDATRATVGGIVGGGAALGGLAGSIGGPPGMAAGAVIGGGGAALGALGGAAIRRANEFLSRNEISDWTVEQIALALYITSLEKLEIFGVRRWEGGRDATREALETMRREMALSPIAITLYQDLSVSS